MDDHKIRVFKAISSFVQDLDTGFGKKYKPVALYNRLVSKTTEQDTTAIDRHIKAFRTFFAQNQGYTDSKTIANNARIVYSDRVYLDVGRILSKTESEAHKHIHQHLLTIYSIMNIGTEEGKRVLEELKKAGESTQPDLNLPNTAEGNFIKDTLTEMTDHFDNMEVGENPMAMMSSMMQSGFFTKFMGDLQTKFSSGEMNLRSLMSTVTGVISEAAPQNGEEATQIRSFVNQSMQQVTALTGEQELPPDIQEPMNELLGTMTGATKKKSQE